MTADHYIRDVERALSDLPWSQRRDLVADLRNHLAELPPDTDLVARLGAPERYAADLRTAEGLPRRHGFIAFLRARRPRNLAIAVLVLVLVVSAAAFAITAVAYVDSYQPLEWGGGSANPPDARSIKGLDDEVVDFHAGRPFYLGLDIENAGRFSVRVLGVPYLPYPSPFPHSSLYPWKAHLTMWPTYTEAGKAHFRRFKPYDLQPGEHLFLELQGVWKCGLTKWDSHLTTEVADFPVRYRFFWRTATKDFVLPYPFAIRFPHGCR